MAVAMDSGISANDQPTLDQLTQRLDIHEMNAWMLWSLLKK
jgi:starvation-inducible DNA-binding protein